MDAGAPLTWLGVLGAFTAAWGVWKSTRWFVHKADAVERAAYRIVEASEIIIHEFRPNGGRVEAPVAGEANAQRATIKDVLLDQRSLLAEQRSVVQSLDSKTDTQTQMVLEELRRTNAQLATLPVRSATANRAASE